MTVKNLIKNSSLPPNESELLIAFLLKKRREEISTHLEIKLNWFQIRKFKHLSKKRLDNWPLAYLIKQAPFYKSRFIVSRNVLVPRPETELLLEQALKSSIENDRAKTIIDIGTGSGAIIISLAQELKRIKPALFKTSNFIALDISRSALKIAQQNIRQHQLENKIKLVHSNLLTNINKLIINQSALIVMANLPYLTIKQIKESPSIQKEPKIALDGGPRGLRYYQQLWEQLAKLEYQDLSCLCEIEPGQKQEIELIIKKQFDHPQLKFYPDLKNNLRLVLIRDKKRRVI